MIHSAVCLLLASVISGGESSEKRSPHDLRRAIHAALKASAPAAQPDAEAVAPQLVELFEEVRADRRMAASDRARYRGLLRARLQDLSEKLQKQLPQQRPADVAIPADKGPAAVLAQQANPAGANRQNPNAGNAGAGQGNRDVTTNNAQQLIDLIETTIAPTTWERAGGQGSIRYYSPLRVLVIRQTDEVHNNLGGLLRGVR